MALAVVGISRTLLRFRLLSTSAGATLRARKPVLTLFTKEPCPLCDRAKERMAKSDAVRDRFVLEEVDITDDDKQHLFDEYRYEIPVFHFQGRFLCKNRIDLEALKKALDQYDLEHSGGDVKGS